MPVAKNKRTTSKRGPSKPEPMSPQLPEQQEFHQPSAYSGSERSAGGDRRSDA